MAEQVAGLRASLAGKSLVQVQASPVVRYWLLESVRQFAAGRLSAEQASIRAALSWALGGAEP